MATTAGAGSLIIGVLLVTLGLTMWFQHIVRVFAGVAAILLALVSIPVVQHRRLPDRLPARPVGGALAALLGAGQPRRAGRRSRPPAEQGGAADGRAPQRHPVAGSSGTHTARRDETTVEANGGRNSAG